MNRRAAIALLPALPWACSPPEESHGKAFLGAVLIDGLGGPPLSNSIVVTAGERITAAGPRSSIPIPAEADKIDGSGKVIVPAPIDVCGRADPPGSIRAATPEAARQQVRFFAARKLTVAFLPDSAQEVAAAALEAARDAALPVLARVSTQAEARFLVERGASGFLGMIRDTVDLDPTLVARLRDLRIPLAPLLLDAGSAIETARRNTQALFRAGVPIAAASNGGDFDRELELLENAGIPPLDVLVAATHNGAQALHQPDRGSIEAGKRADLLLLTANPGEDIRNLRKVALRLTAGQWVK